MLFRWNRNPLNSYTLSVIIAENKVTGFIHNQAGHIIIIAGDDNNLYSWNGYSSDFVSNSISGGYPNVVIVPFTQFKNLPLFATKSGVLSYGHANNTFHRVLNIEYEITDEVTALNTYNDTLFVGVATSSTYNNASMTTMAYTNEDYVKFDSVEALVSGGDKTGISITQILPNETENILKRVLDKSDNVVQFIGIINTSIYQFRVDIQGDTEVPTTVSHLYLTFK